jgi:hypothetical protein
MNELEITVQDIENILMSHKTFLPKDVTEALHDELMEYYPEIIRDALKFSNDTEQQTQYVYSAIERLMIFDGLYITEPAIWEITSVYRIA